MAYNRVDRGTAGITLDDYFRIKGVQSTANPDGAALLESLNGSLTKGSNSPKFSPLNGSAAQRRRIRQKTAVIIKIGK